MVKGYQSDAKRNCLFIGLPKPVLQKQRSCLLKKATVGRCGKQILPPQSTIFPPYVVSGILPVYIRMSFASPSLLFSLDRKTSIHLL